MSKSNVLENDFVRLLFHGVAVANLADNAATSPLTNLQLSLHSADPGEAGDQTTSELSYTGYARAAVARTSGGFTISGNTVTLAALVPFGQRTDAGAAQVWTHLGVGTASSGAGKLLYRLPLGGTPRPFVALTSGTFTLPAHGFAVGDTVSFSPAATGSLPGGVTEGTTYFVITIATDTFTVSATSGGASITVSSAGSGMGRKTSPVSVSINITPRAATGTTIVED